MADSPFTWLTTHSCGGGVNRTVPLASDAVFSSAASAAAQIVSANSIGIRLGMTPPNVLPASSARLGLLRFWLARDQPEKFLDPFLPLACVRVRLCRRRIFQRHNQRHPADESAFLLEPRKRRPHCPAEHRHHA